MQQLRRQEEKQVADRRKLLAQKEAWTEEKNQLLDPIVKGALQTKKCENRPDTQDEIMKIVLQPPRRVEKPKEPASESFPGKKRRKQRRKRRRKRRRYGGRGGEGEGASSP